LVAIYAQRKCIRTMLMGIVPASPLGDSVIFRWRSRPLRCTTRPAEQCSASRTQRGSRSAQLQTLKTKKPPKVAF
jgi:hypothetical protein